VVHSASGHRFYLDQPHAFFGITRGISAIATRPLCSASDNQVEVLRLQHAEFNPGFRRDWRPLP